MLCIPTWTALVGLFLFGCLAIYALAMHFVARGAHLTIASMRAHPESRSE
jgi:hypothetical protein